MTIAIKTPLAVAIENTFYAVNHPSDADADGSEVELDHFPIDSQPPRPPRRIGLPVLDALIASGDAVLVDGGLLQATARRLERRHAELEASGSLPMPSERGAYERVLRKMCSGDLHSAAALLDRHVPLEPA